MSLVFVCDFVRHSSALRVCVQAISNIVRGRSHLFESLQQGEMFPNASLQSSSSLSSTHTSSLLAPVKPFSLLPFIYLTCGLMHLLGRQD